MAAKSTKRTAWLPPLALIAMILSLICTIAIVTNAISVPRLVRSTVLDNDEEKLCFGPVIHNPTSHLIFAFFLSAYHLYRTRLLKQRNAQLERANKQAHIDLDMSRRQNAAMTRQNIRLRTQVK